MYMYVCDNEHELTLWHVIWILSILYRGREEIEVHVCSPVPSKRNYY